MTTPDVVGLAWLAAVCVLGCAIGVAYFAALWATVRALPGARNPALLMLASYVLRIGVAVVAFAWLVRTGGLPWAAAALAGFVAGRVVMTRRLTPSGSVPAGETT